MRQKPRISITLEGEILDEVDRVRGLIPRSAWINEALKRIIADEGANF